MTSECRRLLFISYAYPPTGGGGVQRGVKFTKYLPAFGWRPTVLTAANPSVPVSDDDLSADLDPETTILRARTLEPSYAVKKKFVTTKQQPRLPIKRWVRQAGMSVLRPDPQILWNPFAFRVAKSAIRESLRNDKPYEAIYVTGPPFSSFLLGRSLKLRFGLPLVLDFRDEWLLASQYLDNHQQTGLAYRRQLAMFHKVLRAADAVLATTQASANELARHLEQAGGRASVNCVYNGFDEDDLDRIYTDRVYSDAMTDSPNGLKSVGVDSSTTSNRDRLRIVYTGTLWKLTDASPIVSALLQIASSDPIAAAQIDLILAGRRTPEQDAIVRRLDATVVNVFAHDYLPHGQSLELAASADVLLLLLADEPGAERVVPAKLFEYLALRKTVLAICPDGETASLLQTHGQQHVFGPNQTGQIASWLVSKILEPCHVSSAGDQETRESFEHFSRRSLTNQLAGVLASLTATN